MPVTFKISDTEHILSSYIFKANSILFEYTFGRPPILPLNSNSFEKGRAKEAEGLYVFVIVKSLLIFISVCCSFFTNSFFFCFFNYLFGYKCVFSLLDKDR